MFKVPFVQFLRPHGRSIVVFTEVNDLYQKKVEELLRHGFRFEIEELTTGDIHMTISDPIIEEDVASRLCKNGPPVPENVQLLISEFDMETAIVNRMNLMRGEY